MFSPFSISLTLFLLFNSSSPYSIVPNSSSPFLFSLFLPIQFSVNFLLFPLRLYLIHIFHVLPATKRWLLSLSLSLFDFLLLFWWIYYCFWHLCGELLILSNIFALCWYILVFCPLFWIWFNLVWINNNKSSLG